MLANHTPFPADAFEAIDQHEQKFHVFVLRQTLDFATGKLEYADKQAPLCDSDAYFAGQTTGSLRKESDYCAYKPKCDVIVNAVAHAPADQTTREFLVSLKVLRGDLRMIEKVLRVTGERHFRKKLQITRLMHGLIRWGTLFTVRPNPWKLTAPAPFTSLPLRTEYAYGGQCRIDADDVAARRVPSKYRLTAEQQANHPDAHSADSTVPAAHTVFEANTVGRGYAPVWFLKASRQRTIPAPRIELANSPITAKQFWTASKTPNHPVIEPAGLGIRSKLHPGRRNLLGKVDDEFVRANRTLPDDFDFGIWNAAPEDQQTEFLTGGDTIELINLVPHGTVGLISNKSGNSVLRLTLPEHECFVRMEFDDGTVLNWALVIDTVTLEPEDHLLTLVWRATIPCDEFPPIDACEFRMRSFRERDHARCDISDRRRTVDTASSLKEAATS